MKGKTIGALALLLSASTAGAATLQGRIVNGTTGEPARADELAVFDVASSTSEPVARLENVEGEFSVPDLPDAAAAHFRVRVLAGDFEFDQVVSSFDEPMDVFVYDATDQLSDVALLRHHVIFSRDAEHMQVTEFLEYDNRTDPPRLIRASALPMRLHLDHDVHGDPVASVMSAAVPVDVPLAASSEAAVYGLERDLQPGATRVVVRYLLHEENGGLTWSTRLLFPTEDRRILVNPADIAVEAPDMIPTESSIEDYAAWQGLAGAAGDQWTVQLSGGSVASAGGADDHDHDAAETAGAFTEVVSRPNRLTESRNTIFLGLGGMLLFGALGVVLSGRRNAPAAAVPDADRLAVSKIADRFVTGEITREEYEREAARLVNKPKKKSGRTAAPVA